MTAPDVEELGLVFDPADLPVDVAAEGRRVALEYRVVLDWSEELGFTATCAELPRLITRAADATPCVDALFEQAAALVATILAHGLTPPRALRSATARQPRPATPGVGVPAGVSERPTRLALTNEGEDDDVESPTLAQVRSMARWTAYQYRIVMHWADGSYYATCPEVAAAAGFGRTPGGCVDDLRRHLVRHVSDLILSNQMPPEPLQDLERRVIATERAA